MPLPVRGATVKTCASIGIAIYPDDDTSAVELLKDADLALYAAKSQGRSCWVRFRAELREPAC